MSAGRLLRYVGTSDEPPWELTDPDPPPRASTSSNARANSAASTSTAGGKRSYRDDYDSFKDDYQESARRTQREERWKRRRTRSPSRSPPSKERSVIVYHLPLPDPALLPWIIGPRGVHINNICNEARLNSIDGIDHARRTGAYASSSDVYLEIYGEERDVIRANDLIRHEFLASSRSRSKRFNDDDAVQSGSWCTFDPANIVDILRGRDAPERGVRLKSGQRFRLAERHKVAEHLHNTPRLRDTAFQAPPSRDPENMQLHLALLETKVRATADTGWIEHFKQGLARFVTEVNFFLFVPSHAVGKLIGRGGALIRALEKKCGVLAWIGKTTDPPCMYVRGDTKNVQHFLQLVDVIILQVEPSWVVGEEREVHGAGWTSWDGVTVVDVGDNPFAARAPSWVHPEGCDRPTPPAEQDAPTALQVAAQIAQVTAAEQTTDNAPMGINPITQHSRRVATTNVQDEILEPDRAQVARRGSTSSATDLKSSSATDLKSCRGESDAPSKRHGQQLERSSPAAFHDADDSKVGSNQSEIGVRDQPRHSAKAHEPAQQQANEHEQEQGAKDGAEQPPDKGEHLTAQNSPSPQAHAAEQQDGHSSRVERRLPEDSVHSCLGNTKDSATSSSQSNLSCASAQDEATSMQVDDISKDVERPQAASAQRNIGDETLEADASSLIDATEVKTSQEGNERSDETAAHAHHVVINSEAASVCRDEDSPTRELSPPLPQQLPTAVEQQQSAVPQSAAQLLEAASVMAALPSAPQDILLLPPQGSPDQDQDQDQGALARRSSSQGITRNETFLTTGSNGSPQLALSSIRRLGMNLALATDAVPSSQTPPSSSKKLVPMPSLVTQGADGSSQLDLKALRRFGLTLVLAIDDVLGDT